MTSHNQIHRHSNDNFDLIIPFLINQNANITKPEGFAQKRYSVPSAPHEFRLNDTTELRKIYCTKKKIKVQKTEGQLKKSQEKTKVALPAPPLLRLQSAVQPMIRTVKKNRFFKVHSQINHTPANMSVTNGQISGFLTSKKEQSPIPGIKFKKRDPVKIESSKNLSPPNEKLSSFRGQIRKNIKYLKERREWDKKRCINVDYIVNRNCRTFDNLIGEYTRRMDIEQGCKIFIFDSKDLWLKRVLIDRGWIQNINKQSRAFHLCWTNKPYKHNTFRQQITNHYSNSDMITSKTGLHRLLNKYGLTYLQPLTFDLRKQH